MTRAARIAVDKSRDLERIHSDLRMLIDNPDDAGLTPENEVKLHQSLDNITLAMKSLEQIAKTGEQQ